MRIVLDIVTTVCIGLLTGAEFAVSAFVNPVLYKLDDKARNDAIRLFAKRLGTAMPFWYVASLLLLASECIVRWNDPERGWLVLAGGIWAAVILLTLIFLVPINNRIASSESGLSAESFRRQHRRWDMRHRCRVVALAAAMVCFLLSWRIGG